MIYHDKTKSVLNIDVKIGNIDTIFKVDTGAQCDVIPIDLYKKLGSPKLHKNNSIADISVFSGKTTSEVFVVPMQSKPLLGLKSIQALNIFKLNGQVEINTINNDSILANYKDLFEGEVGEVPGFHHIMLKSDIDPVAHSPRKVPLARVEKLKSIS